MLFNDIRLKRTLLNVVRSADKKGMNPRSLNFLKLVLMDKSRCVLFATFPKSGWNWTTDVLSYCVIKQLTGNYHLTYAEHGTLKEREIKPYALFQSADSRANAEQLLRNAFSSLDIDLCFHTHGYWKHAPLWGLDDAKTVFIVRNIPTTLYSYYKSRGRYYSAFEDLFSDGVVDKIIHFYNSWGDFCARHNHYKIYKYEDFKADPVNQFKSLIAYVFNMEINAELLQEALDYYSIDKQKTREYQYCSDEKKHFHFQGLADYSERISPETLQLLYSRINSELRHNFGYTYPT